MIMTNDFDDELKRMDELEQVSEVPINKALSLEDAISEFKEISGIDYKDIAKTELDKKWESKYKTLKKASKGKSQSKD